MGESGRRDTLAWGGHGQWPLVQSPQDDGANDDISRHKDDE